MGKRNLPYHQYAPALVSKYIRTITYQLINYLYIT